MEVIVQGTAISDPAPEEVAELVVPPTISTSTSQDQFTVLTGEFRAPSSNNVDIEVQFSANELTANVLGVTLDAEGNGDTVVLAPNERVRVTVTVDLARPDAPTEPNAEPNTETFSLKVVPTVTPV